MRARSPTEGFTLVELLVAVAIFSFSILSLLFLRESALERAHGYTHQRTLQRVSQQILDDVIWGIEEEMSGSIETPLEATWRVEVTDVSTNDQPFIDCVLTLTYNDETGEEQEYTLSQWIYPDEDSPILDEVEKHSELEELRNRSNTGSL